MCHRIFIESVMIFPVVPRASHTSSCFAPRVRRSSINIKIKDNWACDAQLPRDTNGYGLPRLGAALALMGQPPLVEGGHTSRDLVAPPGSLGPPRGAPF